MSTSEQDYTLITNTEKGAYNVSVMLTQELEKRTGNQGWYQVRDDVTDRSGNPLRDCLALYAKRGTLAGSLRDKIFNTPAMHVLFDTTVCHYHEPDFDVFELPNFDSSKRRGLKGLFWNLRAWFLKKIGSDKSRIEDAQINAEYALMEQSHMRVCSHCGSTQKVVTQEAIPLPSPIDIRNLVNQIVDEYFDKFLRELALKAKIAQ
jgi:hypothetical protein